MKGFTLVELLTVIAIISILAGLTFASVNLARRFADQKATSQEILMLMAGIDRYNNEHGDYPPTSLAGFKIKGNGINEANECLILTLSGRKKGGPFHEPFRENRLENRDSDRLTPKDFRSLKQALDFPQTAEMLYEYVDLWGNPFVYIHHRDYSQRQKLEYTNRDGMRVQVLAARSDKLGTFQEPTRFQIWSFGPNGQNENGEGDDICSWK